VFYAARIWLHGGNPYEPTLIGPGKPFESDWPLVYPLPALVIAAPFALLPLKLVDPLFVGVGTGRWRGR
jgi:hypothetical protein